jgi:hypothetical protein
MARSTRLPIGSCIVTRGPSPGPSVCFTFKCDWLTPGQRGYREFLVALAAYNNSTPGLVASQAGIIAIPENINMMLSHDLTILYPKRL